MTKRAWCTECNGWVVLDASDMCPYGHPASSLNNVEEWGNQPAEQPQLPTQTQPYGPPSAASPAPAPISYSNPDSKGPPFWAVAIGVVLVVGIAFGIYGYFTAPKHGVVHTMNGLVVDVPKGWSLVADKPTQFLITLDGNPKVAVEVDLWVDNSRDDYYWTVAQGARMAGLRVRDATWLGHAGSTFTSQQDAVTEWSTVIWDGNMRTFRADYDASGSDFQTNVAAATQIVNGMTLAPPKK